MVSAGLGESDPRWSPSGDTLYLSGDRRLLAVPAVGPNGEPILGAPKDACSARRRSARCSIELRFNYAIHPEAAHADAGRRRREQAAGADRAVGWAPPPAPTRQAPD